MVGIKGNGRRQGSQDGREMVNRISRVHWMAGKW